MTVDFPDWTAPQAHANAISTTGAPPLVFKRVIDALIGQNIAASGTLTRPASGNFSLNQPGYEILLNVASLTSPAPVVSVELQWYDSTFGQLLDDEIYYFYSGNLNGHFIHGRGPSKGDAVIVVAKNYSGAGGLTFTYTLLQTSRVFTREFWKTITKAGVNPVFLGFTAAPQNMPANVLCTRNNSLAASASETLILPLYTGTARLFGSGSAVAAAASWQLTDSTEQVAGAQIFAQGTSGQAGFAPLGAGSLWLPDIALPRAQCQLTIVNNATAVQLISTNLMAQEDRA